MAAVTALTRRLTALVLGLRRRRHRRRPRRPAPGDARTRAQGAFDLEAHRGGAGLTVESTLAAFGRALDLGVTTLELDTQITRDGRAVVTHDATVDGRKCRDTGAGHAGRPGIPVCRQAREHPAPRPGAGPSTAAAARCRPFPGQKASPGARMPLLSEVFALARSRSADSVRFNIETKISADAPSRDRVARSSSCGCWPPTSRRPGSATGSASSPSTGVR